MDPSINVVSNETILREFGFSDFPKNWTIIEINDLLSSDRGISVGVMYPGDHDPSGIPIIKVTDLKNCKINHSPDFRISRKKHEEYLRTEFQGGELLITLVGDVGKCAIVPQDMKGFNAARAIGVLRFKDQGDIPFIRLCLLSKPLQELMVAWSNTTVQTTLNLKEVKRLPIPWPPKGERDVIARILCSLDDKIELNSQMNETLEAMARAIFKSWFVDFDPVRAKAEGRDTGLPADIAALFPDEFEDIDGREVPRGWGVGTIGGSTTIVGGSTPSTTNASFWENGTHPFVTPKDLAGLSTPILLDTEKKITDLGVDQISSRILPLGTVLLSSRAPIGYIALTKIPVSINQGFIAIICDRALPNYYVLSWVRENLPLIIDRANGTTFLEISKSNFKPMDVLIPPAEVLTKFVQQVEPQYAQIGNNEQQSRTLAQIRDALLPKLMSGEIQANTLENPA